MRLRNLSVSTDRMVGVSAMMVGIASLFIIVYQTHLMRQAQRASALPYLMMSIRSNDAGAYFLLRNAGLGPAVVDQVRVLSHGKAVEGDAYDFFRVARPDRDGDNLSVDRLVVGRLIPAGETVQMLGMGGDERIRMLRDLLSLFEMIEVPRTWLDRLDIPRVDPNRAVLEVTFSSVYGERWRSRSDRVEPEPVD